MEKLEVFGDKCVVVPASESDKILAGFLLLGNREEKKKEKNLFASKLHTYLLISGEKLLFSGPNNSVRITVRRLINPARFDGGFIDEDCPLRCCH